MSFLQLWKVFLRLRGKDLKTFITKYGEIQTLFQKGGQPLIIFIHGLQGSKELFSQLISEPFLSNFDILVPDLLGFGTSSKPVDFDYSVSSFARVIQELIIATGHQRAIIIGHSLGGMIGTKLLESKSVIGLISLEGNLRLDDCGQSQEIAKLSKEEFEAVYLPQLINSLRESSAPSAAFRLSAVQKTDPYALYQTACCIVAACRSGDLLAIFKQSNIKRLLIVGKMSSFASRSALPPAKVVIVPDAGHFLLHDNYPMVVDNIWKFIAEVTGATP